MFRQHKTPGLQGFEHHSLPLILRITPPELAPFHATLHAGCRASQGRFPPPLLMSTDFTTSIQLWDTFTLLVSITRKYVPVKETNFIDFIH